MYVMPQGVAGALAMAARRATQLFSRPNRV
jgi:hypothetical protein